MTERGPSFLTSDTPPTAGLVEHVVRIEPATGFEYRFFSPAGDARIIHLERGAVEFGQPTEVGAFRAGVSPIEKPTRGGFFTSPDYIDIKAEAIIWIEGGASGDSIVCISHGSFFDVEVTLSLFRTNPDGSTSRVLQETIKDDEEHSFKIP